MSIAYVCIHRRARMIRIRSESTPQIIGSRVSCPRCGYRIAIQELQEHLKACEPKEPLT